MIHIFKFIKLFDFYFQFEVSCFTKEERKFEKQSKSRVNIHKFLYFVRSRRYRIRKKEKMIEKLEKAVFSSNVDPPGLKPTGTSYVRRKSSEIRKLFPDSPHKAVNVLKHLWNQMYRSPRKRKLMDSMWSKNEEKEIGNYMYFVGKYRNKKNVNKLNETVKKMTKKYDSLRGAWRHTNMNWSQFHKCTKLSKRKINERKYIRKLDVDNIKSIGNFFNSEHSTFPLPDKKYAGKRFMKMSLAKSCKMYNLLASTTRKISVSTLRKHKPKYVKLQGRIPFRQSCCEVCQNFEFLINHASKYLTGVPSTIDACIDTSMCKYDSYFPKIVCALRTCGECGVEKLKEHLIRLNADLLPDTRKRFLVKQWENKRERIPGTGTYKSYMHWRHDRLSYSELLDQYVKSVEKMSSHSFFAAWNFHQYLVCKNNIEEGQVVFVHDYAQNYLCIHQHEIQALHWSHKQVTMHPSCISYRCPVNGCNQVVLHEVVHLSDDLKHDAHLVKRFQSANIEILTRRGVPIRKMIEFTDQAPSQYKNKTAFRYLCQDKTPRERNFFGVRHGKGPCDACAGRIKGRLAKLVKSETCIVNSARSCFEACKEHFETRWPKNDECCHYMLTFSFTSKIPKRPNTDKWKGVRDTREHMHSVMNTGKDLQLNVRDVVCLCPGCLHGDSICKFSDYVDNWRGFDMKKYDDCPPNFDLWNSVQIRKTVGSREDYSWGDVRTILASQTTFEDLHAYVKRNPLPFFDCHIDNTLSERDRRHLDFVALHYRPEDAPESYAPCHIASDGNCFPRALSFICFRSQEMHTELRVRLVYEAVLNAKNYLNNRYLSRGCNIVYRNAGPCKQIAMYSNFYDPSVQLNVVDIYKKEVLDVGKDGTYCGLWQMAQAANVLRRPVISVYPNELHEGMRLDFNRTFYCVDNKYNEREPVVIMWTPMQVAENSFPVHFVPLLKAVSYCFMRKYVYVKYFLSMKYTCFVQHIFF